MKLDTEHMNIVARKAAEVFKAMGWRWYVKNNKRVDAYIPDVLDIRDTLAQLTKNIGGSVVSSSTGRLHARVIKDGGETFINYFITL